MKITYYIKNVYGQELIYISDSETRDNIATLTGKKTVTKNQLQALELLGHEVVEVLQNRG